MTNLSNVARPISELKEFLRQGRIAIIGIGNISIGQSNSDFANTTIELHCQGSPYTIQKLINYLFMESELTNESSEMSRVQIL